MIFPFPYVRGDKRYPILGYHKSVYALDEVYISFNLFGFDGMAYIMDGRIEEIEGTVYTFSTELSIGAPDDPYIDCKWDFLFNEPNGNDVWGHYYVLLPKNSMTYPTMNPSTLTTTSSFAGGEGDWQLVVMKGPYDTIKPLELTDWFMRSSILDTDIL